MFRYFAFLLLIMVAKKVIAHPDTVAIKDITAKTDIVSGNIHGAEITVLFKKRFPVSKNETRFQSYHFVLHVTDENGHPVGATISASRYEQNGEVISENSTNDQNILETGVGKFFIPYYVLKLSEGQHKLKVKLQVMRFDSAKGKFDPHKVVTVGALEKQLSINKPKTRTIKLYCSGVRVKSHTSGGGSWDFGSSGLPDLIYRVMMESADYTDKLFSSTEMQNSTSGAWIDYTGPIIVSEGDRVTIGVYDNDTLYDDIIGRDEFTIDELLNASSAAKELKFGYVDLCTLKVTEIK